MRVLAVFLAVLMLCGASLAQELVQRSASKATDGTSSPDTVWFLNARDAADTLIVDGFSAWSSATFGMRMVPWTGVAAADTLRSYEDSLIVPAAGITVRDKTKYVIIYDQTAQVNLIGWMD